MTGSCRLTLWEYTIPINDIFSHYLLCWALVYRAAAGRGFFRMASGCWLTVRKKPWLAAVALVGSVVGIITRQICDSSLWSVTSHSNISCSQWFILCLLWGSSESWGPQDSNYHIFVWVGSWGSLPTFIELIVVSVMECQSASDSVTQDTVSVGRLNCVHTLCGQTWVGMQRCVG